MALMLTIERVTCIPYGAGAELIWRKQLACSRQKNWHSASAMYVRHDF